MVSFFAKAIMNIVARLMLQDDEIKDGFLDIISYLEGKGFSPLDSMEFDTGIKGIIPKIARELQDSKVLDKFPPNVQERIIMVAVEDITRWINCNYNDIGSKIYNEIDIEVEIKKIFRFRTEIVGRE